MSEAVKLLQMGMSYKAVAEFYGVTPKQFSEYLNEYLKTDEKG